MGLTGGPPRVSTGPAHSAMTSDPTEQRIELNLQNVHQRVNSLDPSPFHERDLDEDAEEFIVSWAREHPIRQPLRLIVHLRERSDGPQEAELITGSIHHYFAYKAELNRREFRRLMTEGWVSLLIGLSFLIVCAVIAQGFAPRLGAWAPLIREGLTIIGWVAMWRPLDTYLYRWWPVYELGRIYRKLSCIPIELSDPPASPP